MMSASSTAQRRANFTSAAMAGKIESPGSPGGIIKTVYASSAWICAYLALVLFPFALLLIGERPHAGGFWWDFALALGYSGFSMMAVLFWLTARFKHASAPFGIDILYYFHRYLAVAAFVVLLLHVGVFWLRNRPALGVLDPREAPWHMTAGRVALLGFATLLTTSLLRKRLHLAYERWRRAHVVLAVLAMGAAVGHIEGAGTYLADPTRRWLWTLLAGSWLVLTLHVRLLRPSRLRRRPYRVTELIKQPGRSWTLKLSAESGRRLDYRAGQFAWLALRASPFALAEHPFSFSSCPADGDMLEFTIKELGDFTSTIGSVQPGEIAYVDGPYGGFELDRYADAPGFIFAAGGAGIAPVISVLRDLAARGERRPLWLFYGNRRWDRVVFREELEALCRRLDLRVVHVLGEPPPDWSGEAGYVDGAVLARHLPADCRLQHAFVCGPVPMIRMVEEGLQRLHMPSSHVHSELFDLV